MMRLFWVLLISVGLFGCDVTRYSDSNGKISYQTMLADSKKMACKRGIDQAHFYIVRAKNNSRYPIPWQESQQYLLLAMQAQDRHEYRRCIKEGYRANEYLERGELYALWQSSMH